MDHQRRTALLARDFPRRAVSPPERSEPSAFCQICGEALLPSEERRVVTHWPALRFETWCLRCWTCLLLHAQASLRQPTSSE